MQKRKKLNQNSNHLTPLICILLANEPLANDSVQVGQMECRAVLVLGGRACKHIQKFCKRRLDFSQSQLIKLGRDRGERKREI